MVLNLFCQAVNFPKAPVHQLHFILTYRFKRDLKNGRMTPAVINCVKQVREAVPQVRVEKYLQGLLLFLVMIVQFFGYKDVCESYTGVCNIVIYLYIGFIRCDLISGD